MSNFESKLISLLTIFISFCGRTSKSTWSAHQEGPSDKLPGFHTRLDVNLLYYNDSEAESNFYMWRIPSVCNVLPENLPAASLTCPQGIHVISAAVKVMNTTESLLQERYIPFVESPFCYKWYTYTDLRSNRTQDSGNIRIWIVDPKYQSYEEEKGRAETPSEHSLELTRLFKMKGQLPNIKEVHPEPFSELNWEQVSFSNSHGYWIIPIILSRKFEYVVRIDGKTALAVKKCLVWSTDAVIMVPKFNISQSNNDELLRGSINYDVIVKDPCAFHVAVAVRENVLFTQDGFNTVSHLRMSASSYDVNDTVIDVVFTSDKINLLMQSGKLFHLTVTGDTYKADGVQKLKFRYMVGKESCLPPSNKDFMDPILSWNDNHVYLAEDGLNFTKLNIPSNLLSTENMDADAEVIILDAAFTTDADHVIIMFRVDSNVSHATVPLSYSLRTKLWERSPFWVDDTLLHNYRMKRDLSSVDSFLFWNDRVLLFSKRNGSKRGMFSLVGDLNWYLNQSVSGVIYNVEVFDGGQIFVQMTSGATFLGNLNDEKLTLLPSFSTAGCLYQDASGSAYSVTISSSGYVSKQLILKRAQFGSAVHPHRKEHPCKLFYFEIMEDLKSVYYLDRMEILQLWSRLIHPTNFFNDIEVIYSNMATITVESSKESDFHPRRKTIKTTISISSNVNFYESIDYYRTLRDATGIFSVQMKPKQTGLGCLFKTSMIAHVAVGCPPGRHIRIQKTSNCSLRSDEFLSSATNGDELADNDQIVETNADKFGCPFVISDRDTFKPVVNLYDGDQFVEEVLVDFIVMELQGRSDFTYNASESLVGCQSAAQSWSRMLESVSHDFPEYGEAWGPHNYRPCFTSSNTSSSPEIPYEIMNKSGISALTWNEKKDDHLYYFHLKVVDPHYSFCSLEDDFAVEVRGSLVDAKEGKEVIGFVVVAFAVLTLSLGLASYAFFRKDHIEEWKRNQAEECAIDNTAEEVGEEMTQTEEELMASKRHVRRLTVLER